MDLLGYLKANKRSFKEDPLRQLDVLPFTWMTYIDMPLAVKELPLRLGDWKNLPSYANLRDYHRTFLPGQSEKIMKTIAESPRFEDSVIIDYEYRNIKNKNLQFGAIAVRAGGKIIISFEGTDLTYVGWREDAVMSYSDSIASYEIALQYLKKIIAITSEPIIISGHSKGGNVATYCLANINDDSRIEAVYSYEGPGFHFKGIFKDCPERASKLCKFIPKNAIVGVMLNNDSDVRIVKSFDTGILQHNPLRWAIKDNDFIYVQKRTMTSYFIDASVNSWIESMTAEDKQRFIELFFTNVEACGPDDLMGMNNNLFKFIPIFRRAYRNLNKEDKSFFDKTIKQLRETMWNVFISSGRKKTSKSRQAKEKAPGNRERIKRD